MENYERFNLGLSEKPKPNKKKEEKENSESSPGLTRRDFLKMAAVTGVTLASSPVTKKIVKEFGEEEKGKSKDRPETEEKIKPTEEQQEIEEENIKSIKEIVDFEREEEVELSRETAEALTNYWKKRYSEEPALKNSLEGAYEKMSTWDKHLKEEFKGAGVPEKFRYLLIPESHGKFRARSSVGAVGPYQFMPQTGRSYGLDSKYYGDCHPNIEERQDPVKSARACAELLRDLYNKGGEDWDLALSGYNGSFYWKYLKQARQENEEKSYEEFLNFLAEKINKIKKEKHEKIKKYEEMLASEYMNYFVKKGDGLRKIAMKFRTNIEELQNINQIKDPNRIGIGQEIKIPVSPQKREEIKKKIKEEVEKEFWSEVSGFSENLNYPPKFNAVMELIDEGFVSGEAEPLGYEIYTVPENRGDKVHYFKKGDKSVWSIAQKYEGVSVEDISKANSINFDPNNLQEGDKIIIPNQKQKPTLLDIAKEKNKSPEELSKLNPAIINPEKEIPAGYKIRV